MADRSGQTLGHYRLVRLLGQGGFAEVYLGEHIHLGTVAALKLLHTQLTGEDTEAFRQEARTIARLVHPHIVRVFDFGIEGETPYLVMDYAPNGTVRKRFPKGALLPLPTILSYAQQTASALQYAHDEHIIHRDVKPENLLLSRRQELLLGDFGIALLAQASRSQSMQDVAGTASYMAPEQFQGKPRPASDQYALAVMVYEWLTGACPFHGSFTEIASQHLFVPPPPLQGRTPAISPAVEQVVLTALTKDPHQRFSSVQAFATAFEQACQLETSPPKLPSQSLSPTQAIPQPPPVLSPTELAPPASQSVIPTELSTPPSSSPIPTEHSALPSQTEGPAARVTPPIQASLPPTELASPASSQAPLSAEPAIAPSAESTVPASPPVPYVRGPSSQEEVKVPTDTPLANATPPPVTQSIQAPVPPMGHTRTEQSLPPTIPAPVPSPAPSPTRTPCKVSRRTVLVGLAAGGVVVAGGGIAWLVSSQGQNSSLAPGLTSTLAPSLTSTPAPSLTSTPIPPNPLLYTYRGHSDAVSAVAWSPDGRRIASGSSDKTVQVWDASTGGNIYTYRGHSGYVDAVAWSPNGKRIASASQDSTVQVWDASTGGNVYTYRGHSKRVWALAWSPDGKRIASGSYDSTVQVWEASTGGNVYTYRGHSGYVNWPEAIAWSPDGKRIASGSADKTVQVWDASTGGNVYTYRGHSNAQYGVTAVAWSPDGKRIASGSSDHTVQVWDAANGGNVYTYRGHSDYVAAVAWSPDGKHIASGSEDKTVQVWQAQ